MQIAGEKSIRCESRGTEMAQKLAAASWSLSSTPLRITSGVSDVHRHREVKPIPHGLEKTCAARGAIIPTMYP